MSKFFRILCLCFLSAVTLTVYAHAGEDILKVGLYYGNTALYSANLQNERGSGYQLGWFDEETRDFVPMGYLAQEKISVTADGTIYITGGSYSPTHSAYVDGTAGGYHVQLDHVFVSYDEAAHVAGQFSGGFPAFINNSYRVRIGSFLSREEAEIAAATIGTYSYTDLWGMPSAASAAATAPTATAVTVTRTGTAEILFQFDCSGAKALGIQPVCQQGDALTWFKGYKWYGGFEYRRSTGGNINVINVVNIDDYVKGVLPYEMNEQWPLEALKAQAVCARTYALLQSKHYKSYRFDVCNTTDCQVYLGSNRTGENAIRAAEETAGIVATYRGEYAETTYCSSNGGASESAENVWLEARGYLVGKVDPYEAMTDIPNYTYRETYTFDQLTEILHSKKYDIGSVCAAYVSRQTPTGNVSEVTFRDTAGKTVRVTGDTCRTVFYTTLYGGAKSVKSMRFTISGGGGGGYSVNGGLSVLPSLSGAALISGGGAVSPWSGGDTYVITSSGLSALGKQEGEAAGNAITITGTGSGHNVGMSQYGAKAMAEQGYLYEDILRFYYTDIVLERIGDSF